MSKTEVSGKQIKDGSIELVDLSATVSGDITQLKSDVSTLQTDVAGKASVSALATVATSGSYNDLADKPSIPSVTGLASETYVDTAVAAKADSSSLATVATSGAYADLTGKPTLFDGAYSSLSGAPSIPSALDDLSDVTLTSPANGQVLSYNGTAWVNSAASSGGASDLDGLSDVTLTSSSNGQFLKYNGSAWVNSALPEASSSVAGIVTTGTQTIAGTKTFSGQVNLDGKGIIGGATPSAEDLFVAQQTYNGGAVIRVVNPSTQSAAYSAIRLGNSTSGEQGTIAILSSSNSNGANGMLIMNSGNNFIDHWTNGTRRTRIDGAGLVGINETTLSAQLNVTSGAAARIGINVKAAASQTASLISVTDNGNATFDVLPTTYISYRGSYIRLRFAANGTNYLNIGNHSQYGLVLGWNAGNEAFSTLLGASAGLRFTGATSGYNVAVGSNAMAGSTGTGAGTGQMNVAVGYNAAVSLRSGNYNTFVGNEAGYSTTTGSSNICIGVQSGYNITTGSNNSFVGGGALATAATNSYQVVLGRGATTNGDNAVAIGRAAAAEANCFSLGFGNAIRMTGDANGHMAVANTFHAKRYTETVANAFDSSLAPSSGTLTVDTSLGNAVLGALNAAVTTWAFTNVPTDNSKVTKVTVVLDGTDTYTYGDACSVNGSAVTDGVMWSGGSAPTATNNFDIIEFTIVKDSAGTFKVFGVGTTNFS